MPFIVLPHLFNMKAGIILTTLVLIINVAEQNPLSDISQRMEAMETRIEEMSEELRTRDEKITNLEANRTAQMELSHPNSAKDVSDIPYGIWCSSNDGMWFDDHSIINFYNGPQYFFQETNLPGMGQYSSPK